MNDQSDHAADEKRKDFEQNWPEYHDSLYPYVLSLTRNEADAKDITQQTLLNFRAHMEKNLWEPEIKDLGAYLRRTARNLYMDLCKERGHEPIISGDDEQNGQIDELSTDPRADIEDKIYAEERCQSINWNVILGGLSQYELELFTLNVVERLSAKEMAKETGRDVYKVRYDLNKIKAKIRARAKRVGQGNGKHSV